MGVLLRVLWGAFWRTMVFGLVVAAGIVLMNRTDRWEVEAVVAEQSGAPQGRVGLVVVALAMPEQYDPVFFENFLDKLFTSVIPWPINVLAGADAGVALMDPDRPYAPDRFEPQRLADVWGREADIDGVPWVEKHRRGEVRWQKPSATVPHDTGYFLYPDRKGGIRTATAKTMLKARYIYYANLPDGYLPHESQTMDMARTAITQVDQVRPLVAAQVADAFDPWQLEQAVRAVLDAGVDTLIVASVQPIHSDFEEYNGSFQKVHKVIEAWRATNGGKPIDIMIAPMLASQPSFDTLWLDHLDATVPSAGSAGQSAEVVISLHGLPVSLVDSDSWSGRTPSVTDRIAPKIAAAMSAKGYASVEVTAAFEGFADGPEDPGDRLLSVAEQIRVGVGKGADVVAVLPIEFMAENTDTLFAHAVLIFDGMPGYASYQGPPEGTDWARPYVRDFQTGSTRVIYTGSPGGAMQTQAARPLADAILSLWEQP